MSLRKEVAVSSSSPESRTTILILQVSPTSLLKNPMILIGIVAMALMFGMPKLMENSTYPIFTWN